MHPWVGICLFLFLVPCTSLAYPFTSLNVESESDQLSLVAFKTSVTSDPSNVFGNWLPTIHFCNWTGVTCYSALQKVKSLNLTSRQLQGYIPLSIGNLSLMKELHLRENSFTGEIPEELGRIRGLKMLSLSYNELQGSIPKNLTACKELQTLSLTGNNLTGTIPPEVGALVNLTVLQLGFNNLTGNIPPSLGNLSSLQSLILGSNNLEGHIPPELGKLTHLKSLLMFENPRLTGPIPLSLSNMSSLVEMALYSNKLTGTIPSELGKLTALVTLHLWNNQLKDRIPAMLSNCSQLYRLGLGRNYLTGVVPLELNRLLKIRLLSLPSNRLVSGSSTTIPILEALTNCTKLVAVDLEDNQLTGKLPDKFPQNLSRLRLGLNHIEGSIPTQIGKVINLRDLNLSYNLFTGHIPSSLRSLQKMQRLWLDNNKLEGSIPREFGEITNLGELSASHNMLSGEIPETISSLQQLRYLVLHHNQLSGRVPASLGKCYRLELLDLSSNRLEGSLPREVVNLPNLQIYFNLSNNSLHGPLPAEIGSMVHVQAIDISSNRLEGQIPATLGSCQGLQYLKLSSNALWGLIPDSFRNLLSMVDMDLSFNNLSGPISPSLTSLTMLQHLNLSFNNLTGEIPEVGVFKNFTYSSFMGNSFLCGERIHPPACLIQSTGKNSNQNKIRIIVPVTVAFAFVFCCLILWRLRDWKGCLHMQSVNADSSEENAIPKFTGQQPISYEDIVRATDGFNHENLLGTGRFGSVYKGIFDDGKAVAIKLLNLEDNKASKNFVAECKLLGRARHHNLLKVLAFCSEFGNKMLVLQFMPRGNLQNLLFGDGTMLSFKQILNIAIDVIHGLEYLHHDCLVQVVHCHLKPSNIFLDRNLTAHVADFGLARLVYGPDYQESVTTSSLLKESIGYIAPEYLGRGEVTPKGDIYSFGVIILEMVTRKNPAAGTFGEDLNLQKWVSTNLPNAIEKFVDTEVMKDLEEYEIQRGLIPFVCIGLECSNVLPQDRPTTREVAQRLETIRGTLNLQIRT